MSFIADAADLDYRIVEREGLPAAERGDIVLVFLPIYRPQLFEKTPRVGRLTRFVQPDGAGSSTKLPKQIPSRWIAP